MSLISIGLSGLNASSAAMTTIGNNTANVDTAGYSRQQVMTAAAASQNIGIGYIGTGTTLSDVRRIYNSYLDTQLQTTTSLNADATAYSGQVSTLDSLLSDSATGVSGAMSSFFESLQALSKNTAGSAERTTFLKSAQTLSARFNSISSQINDQNASINTQLTALSGQVNSLASSIATMNKQITEATASGGEPNALLDSRNEAVRSLNELVGAKVVQNNGSYDVYIGTGQPLVTGTTANTLTASPSSSDPSLYSLKLTYQQVTADVTSVVTGGSIGGLVRYRTDVLQPAANELGRLALVVSDQVNTQLNQGIDSNGNFGSNLFTSINDPALTSQRSLAATGNSAGSGNLDVTIADSGALTTSNYQVTFGAPDAAPNPGGISSVYTVKRLPDGKDMGTYDLRTTPAPVIEKDGVATGFSLSQNGGDFKQGDSFKVIPTRTGAANIQTVATDTKAIAIAGALTGTIGAANSGTGTFSMPSLITQTDIYDPVATTDLRSALSASMPMRLVMGDVVSGAQSYKLVDSQGAPVKDASGADITSTLVPGQNNDLVFNVGYTDSKGVAQSYSFGMTVTGSPNSADTYNIDLTGAGSTDNRNGSQLLDLQTRQTVDIAAGNGTGMSLGAANTNLIQTVGAQAKQGATDATATAAVLTQAKTARDSVSGVSLDEEAANLVKYQQYYTASSQIIKAAQAVFSTLINSL